MPKDDVETSLSPNNRSKEQKIIGETNLSKEWLRQANRYIGLGAHNLLDLLKKDYISSLPKFEPQPETFKGRFDIPILVDPRIDPWELRFRIGVHYRNETSNETGIPN